MKDLFFCRASIKALSPGLDRYVGGDRSDPETGREGDVAASIVWKQADHTRYSLQQNQENVNSESIYGRALRFQLLKY